MIGKRIAIIGANGFIGRHLVYYLQKQGSKKIDCYDVVDSAKLPNFRGVDLTDRDALSTINLNIDYIFMFAGFTGTYAGFDAYQKYININEIALINLLDTIRKSEYRPMGQ